MRKRQYGFLPIPANRLSVMELVAILAAALFIGGSVHASVPPETPKMVPITRENPKKVYRVKSACNSVSTKTVVSQNVCLIHMYSDRYDVDTEAALRIAECESYYGKYPHNWSGSSAKGVYMFIGSTWEYTGGGDVLDPEQNIERFMQFYPKNPHWWECK